MSCAASYLSSWGKTFHPGAKILTFLFFLHPLRTVLPGTTEESSQKAAAGEPALCWLLVCPAVATTTAMSVTPKLESAWYVCLGGN